MIKFTGSAKEYFGIWIVNVVLSIVTIGIYSAWAKVKREIYFKNNTQIGEIGFGYHATGMQIFKGRLIAFVVLVALNVTAAISPIIGVALIVVLVFLLPVIINNSMKFSARVTSFRNVRFNWHGTYWKSFWFFVIAPAVSVLTLGLLMPLISKAYYAYFAKSHSYGTSNFSCEPSTRDYYLAFALGVVVPSLLIVSTIAIIIVSSSVEISSSSSWEVLDNYSGLTAFLGLFVPFTIIIAFILAASIYKVLCRNLMMKSLELSDVASFGSEINPIKLVWIRISNTFVVILTLGFMIPWANVRVHKYLSECSTIHIEGDLDKFLDDAAKNKSAFGEELAELEGFEVNI